MPRLKHQCLTSMANVNPSTPPPHPKAIMDSGERGSVLVSIEIQLYRWEGAGGHYRHGKI